MNKAVRMRLCPSCAAAMRSARDKRGRALHFVETVEGAEPRECRCAMKWENGSWPLYRVMDNPYLGQNGPRQYAEHTAAGRRDARERRAR